VPFGRLARVIVAGLDGLILQYVCDPDESRSRADVEAMVDMVVALAGPARP
jgi:TetR/AcrR family transcriptional regulator, regulator of biofilm formation and stress response